MWFMSGLVDLKNKLLLISFFSFSFFLMHDTATHNIGLGSYNGHRVTESQSHKVTESQSHRVTDTLGYSVYGWVKFFCA